MIPGINHFLKWDRHGSTDSAVKPWAYGVVYEVTPAFLEVTQGWGQQMSSQMRAEQSDKVSRARMHRNARD